MLKTDLVHEVYLEEGKPGTHAIVIGIGTYPFGRDIHDDVALNDLKSPIKSAKAIADWLIQHYNNPDRPLASVALIVSDNAPFVYRNPVTELMYEVPTGTTQDIENCVDSWSKRAGDNFDNGAVF